MDTRKHNSPLAFAFWISLAAMIGYATLLHSLWNIPGARSTAAHNVLYDYGDSLRSVPLFLAVVGAFALSLIWRVFEYHSSKRRTA